MAGVGARGQARREPNVAADAGRILFFAAAIARLQCGENLVEIGDVP